MLKRILPLLLFICALTPVVTSGQRPSVTLTLDDRFFDALLEAVFRDGGSLDFPMDDKGPSQVEVQQRASVLGGSCVEVVSIRKESRGRKTLARLMDGKIFLPMAFSGTYDPPLLPCIEYSGFAETEIVLDFDRRAQTLIGRVVVTKVSLDGTGGVASGLVARLVQNSIDKRVNPIQIVGLDKVSMMIPVQNSANVSMKAVDVKHRISRGLLTLTITYDFLRN